MRRALTRLALVASILMGGIGNAAPTELALGRELRAFVAARAGVDPATIAIPSLADFEPEASDRRARFDFSTHPRASLEGLTPVTIVIHRGAEEIRRGSVSVRIGAPAQVLVATRALPAQAVLTASDVQTRAIEGRPPAGSVAEIRALLGKQTTRAVSAGSVWQRNHVQPVPVVTRGQPVRLRLETGGLWIEGPGQAREDGLAGDSIRVLNLTSRREVRGTVTPEGLVRVDY